MLAVLVLGSVVVVLTDALAGAGAALAMLVHVLVLGWWAAWRHSS